MTDPQRSYRLGNLDLTDYPYAVLHDFSLGAPPSLDDGDRVLEGTILVEGADLGEVEDNAAALMAELRKQRNEFAVYRHDFSAWSVFDVGDCTAELEPKDWDEVSRIQRWNVSLTCLQPFSRDADPTVTPATPVPPATVVNDTIDACTEPSGWVTKYGGPPTEPVEGWLATSGISPAMTRLGAVSLAGRQYLTITVALVGERWEPNINIGAAVYRPLMRLPDVQGWEKITYLIQGNIPAGGFSITTSTTTDQSLIVNTVSASSHPPVVGTRRQTLRTVEVGGSAPTQGNIHVNASSGALGDSLVYTWPRDLGNYSPTLSPHWQTGASLVFDSNAVSGAYRDIATAGSWLVPADALPPGDYTLVARMKTDAAAGYRSVIVETKSWVGGVAIGAPTVHYPSAYLPGGLTYRLVPLGKVTLPPTRVGSSGFAQVVLLRGAGETAPLYVDELYAFHESGALTMLEAHSSKHLWVEAPSLDEPQGAIWVGNAADGSDKWHAGWLHQSWESHTFDPEGMNLLAVTGGVQDALVDLTHYRRHHTHATTESA